MNNVRLRYLYRDSSNYKCWGDVVLSNSQELSVSAATKRLRKELWLGELFIASQIRLPSLFLFQAYAATQDDHCFHEFSSLDATDDAVTDEFSRSIAQFVGETESAHRNGWQAFDAASPWCKHELSTCRDG